jgi:membrane protein
VLTRVYLEFQTTPAGRRAVTRRTRATPRRAVHRIEVAPEAAGPGRGSDSGRPAQWVADTEGDRGRKADTPTDIPAKGWKDVLTRVY